MSGELSPQIEQYLAGIVAGSFFSSREAALEAAICALREKIEPIPFAPDEPMERLEQAIESANAGRCRGLKESRRSQPPSEYAEQFKAYTQGTSRGGK